ncbi:MAG TPA: NADH-quinone oxidoreductase subunit J [Cyclobacteriaceae bacterium]|nr:NADH-quinone oxidoreductase subunit J [Cyclobacteriaceae bacterium]
MEFQTLLYYFFVAIAGLSALAMVFMRNVLYTALMLIVTLLSLAAIYILLNAEFIAVTQILIYAGGILVIMLFGIMLSTRLQGKPLMTPKKHIVLAVLTGLAAFVVIFKVAAEFRVPTQQPAKMIYANPVNEFGVLIMSDWLLPFEIAGILLLICLVGAAQIAKAKTEKHA